MTRRPRRGATLYCTTAIAMVLIGSQAYAGERELDAHQHGLGALNIAIEGTEMWIELETPGADIVGFEHPAGSDADKAAIEEARARLSDPIGLFGIPSEASCALESVAVTPVGYALATDDNHRDEHEDHDAHGEDAHDDEHEDHDAHSGDAHDDEHEDHDVHDEGETTSHAEFHAEYVLHCADPAALDRMTLTYFEVFPGAEELAVTVITEAGQSRHEATRERPIVRLGAD